MGETAPAQSGACDAAPGRAGVIKVINVINPRSKQTRLEVTELRDWGNPPALHRRQSRGEVLTLCPSRESQQ